MLLSLFFSILFIGEVSAAPRMLPSVLYPSQNGSVALCQNPHLQSINYWAKLTDDHIERLRGRASLSGLKMDVYTNQLVTMSYLEFFKQSSATSAGAMGYIYANASHHLGRLVRNKFWPEVKDPADQLTAQADLALIRGGVLEVLADTFPRTLSSSLMAHSLKLYKALSWSLAAGATCGGDYVLNLIEDERCIDKKNCTFFPGLAQSEYEDSLRRLRRAFLVWDSPRDFTRQFVAFEQDFLQHTMYSEVIVGTPASLGFLDAMRFIPFSGVHRTSFKEWCEKTSCGHTSQDQKARTLFDQTMIDQEWNANDLSPIHMGVRLKNSNIEKVFSVIMKALKIN